MNHTARLIILMLVGAFLGSQALGMPILGLFRTRVLLQYGDPGIFQIGAIAGAFLGLLAEALWRLEEGRFRFGIRDWFLFAAFSTTALGIMAAVTRYIHTRT